ncbi:hypothetical protein IWX49DRAFT_166918 [Phyllosticta citricarpa]|uniref:Extracellular membrane protein CFEM domain-containing protein n=2 Tax=Phyllosticta TaxID=121621 RepID=A0ABR1MQX3_9PEZI
MVGKNQLNLQCCWFIGGAALAICSAVNFSLRSTVDQLYEKLLTVSSPDIRHVSVLSRLDPPQSYLPLQTSLKMKYTLSLISATLLAATAMAQNLKILEDSCAAGAFEAASSSSDRPCQTTDFLCVCTTGKDWYDNYITEYLSNHPGTCTEAQIAQIPEQASEFCNTVPGFNESSSSGGSVNAASASTTATGTLKNEAVAANSTSTHTSSHSGTSTATSTNAAAAVDAGSAFMGLAGVMGLAAAVL